MLNAAVLVEGCGGRLKIVWQILANFHSCTVQLDIVKVFYLPTDAQ